MFQIVVFLLVVFVALGKYAVMVLFRTVQKRKKEQKQATKDVSQKSA
jgi:cytoskeletal protein RodZ